MVAVFSTGSEHALYMARESLTGLFSRLFVLVSLLIAKVPHRRVYFCKGELQSYGENSAKHKFLS